MAVETACQTPGTFYETKIEGRQVSVVVTLPMNVPPPDAERLEATVHNALELVLAPLFVGRGVEDLADALAVYDLARGDTKLAADVALIEVVRRIVAVAYPRERSE